MSVRKIVINALLTALIIVLTCVIVIPIGINGYVNLSDLLIMLLSQYLDVFGMFIIGGIGCALADIFLGYSQYAIFTLIIKSLEGIVMCYLYKNKIIKSKPLLFIIGAMIMLIGYAISDVIMTGDIMMLLASIVANMSQAIVCTVAAILLYKPFELIGRKINESK